MERLWRVLGCVVVLLVAAEAGARLLEWAHPETEDVAFEYAPYRMLRMTSAPFALNRDGFRAKEWEAYRGKFLVEFLGGSVCLGIGTDPGRPVPERLEEALHKAGMEQAVVINLCQGGTASAQELAIFLEYGLPLRPQVVISFNGANDLFHPLPLGEDPQANLPYHDREMRALFAGRHSWTEHLGAKRVSDRLYRRLNEGALSSRQGTQGVVAPGAILDSYFYTTDVVRTLTQAQDGLFGLVLQPALHYSKPWSKEESAMWKQRRPRDWQVATDYAHSLYAQTRTAAAVWSAESGGRLFDLTETFRQTAGTVYTDSVHFKGDTGFRMLTQELERQGLVQAIAERYRVWETGGTTASPEKAVAWRH